jgi:hypothetical protein
VRRTTQQHKENKTTCRVEPSNVRKRVEQHKEENKTTQKGDHNNTRKKPK